MQYNEDDFERIADLKYDISELCNEHKTLDCLRAMQILMLEMGSHLVEIIADKENVMNTDGEKAIGIYELMRTVLSDSISMGPILEKHYTYEREDE